MLYSLSGSFIESENDGQCNSTGGLSVLLSRPDDRVLGGNVVGFVVAASPVPKNQEFLLECHQYSPDEHVGNLLLQRECCIFSNGEYVKAGLAEVGICCRHAKKEVMLLSDLSVIESKLSDQRPVSALFSTRIEVIKSNDAKVVPLKRDVPNTKYTTIMALWTRLISNTLVEFVQGGRSVDVRANGVNKGVGVSGLLGQVIHEKDMTSPIDYVLCVGHFRLKRRIHLAMSIGYVTPGKVYGSATEKSTSYVCISSSGGSVKHVENAETKSLNSSTSRRSKEVGYIDAIALFGQPVLVKPS
ncbi:alpha,alpha-trehalose-phosphate synthase [UDP-forming] 1-like protein [Tanacetum coccineum]|uniref:AT-hook motif nuclear-localized protein n=1 Tax=Tanacetum coccineum TaxID=301880 RepID=A0ABQ5GV98_9ASTR